MAGDEPEVGDKASWSWNGSHPSGEVAEKKAEGEVSIQSKRGNTIKKSAQPDDPAIHLSRPGNDVVKNASELHVDEKKSSDAAAGDDAATEDEPEKEEPAAKKKPEKKEKANGTTPAKKGGVKRKASDEGEGNGEKKVRGRPKGAGGKEKPAKKDAGVEGSNGDKKARGRPKKEGGVVKEKKPKVEKPMKPKAPPSGVGKRTRSHA